MEDDSKSTKNEFKNLSETAEKVIESYIQRDNVFEKEDIVKNMYNIDKNVVKKALDDFDKIVSLIENNLSTSKKKQTSEETIIAVTNKRSFIQMMSEMCTIIDNDNKEFHSKYDNLCQDLDDTKRKILMLEKQLSYMK